MLNGIFKDFSGMKKTVKIIKILKRQYPSAKIALNFKTPHQLLVAAILSAQCTDKKVNEVTCRLFKKYKTIKDFASADIKEFSRDIRPTGFYRNKARNIIESSKKILSDYKGCVPEKMDELIKLPGVARKTANVVLGSVFHKACGITVDTHVKRIANRLGLTNNLNPEKIEKDLMELVPKEDWIKVSYLIIEHGRKVCKARKPLCQKCVLNKLCPAAFKIL